MSLKRGVKMIKKYKKCPECGEKFRYIDIRNVPDTCGKKMCKVNHAYRLKHYDPRTGVMPEAEEVRKWKR